VAQWGCGGSGGMWWLRGDVMAQEGCGGSGGMWWLSGDVVVQGVCGGSVGIGLKCLHVIVFGSDKRCETLMDSIFN
jgi:hypothetical protein